MMRVGLYRPVHVKTLRSQKLRMLLTHRSRIPPGLRSAIPMVIAYIHNSRITVAGCAPHLIGEQLDCVGHFKLGA